MAFYALGLALLPLAAGLWSLLAVAVLLGFANGIGTGVVMIIGADLARASGRHGQFLGLWRLIGDVGISGAPLLAGTVVKSAGLAAASLTVAGLGVVGALVMAFVVVETLRTRPALIARLPPCGIHPTDVLVRTFGPPFLLHFDVVDPFPRHPLILVG